MNRLCLLLSLVCILTVGDTASAQSAPKTFTNPLLPYGADPYSFYRDGYYYYTHTMGSRLVLWKTKNLADLAHAEQQTVWTPPAGTMYSKELWAPEILFLKGKWYMYFAADDGNNKHHRMYVIENSSPDPMRGQWVFKGKVAAPTDKWAIDGDVIEYKNKLYMIWSGWPGDVNGQQNIYIAPMRNPWTIGGERVLLSEPQYEWERYGHLQGETPPQVNVNEGPQFLMHKNRLFIVYSASGCWTDHYALGMLTLKKGGDLLRRADWVKSADPVFKAAPENGVYAPGHNSFFKSPDGKEDWILYHANAEPGQGCGGHRSPRAQPFSWSKDGMPVFGKPLPAGTALTLPAQNQFPVIKITWQDSAVVSTGYKGNGWPVYGAQYPRLLQLKAGQWLAAYTVSENQGYRKDANGGLTLEVAQSDDNGKTWRKISDIRDPGRDLDNAEMIHLKDGAILLAARSVRWQESYRLPVYKSTDNGHTWKRLGQVDANEGVPESLGHPDKGIYEPHLYLLDDGRLTVVYANEKHVTASPSYSQVISQKISPDLGKTWGQEIWVAHAPGHPLSRPGMPVITKMQDGSYMVVYEVCGPEACGIYYKTSADGVQWQEGMGIAIPDQKGAPYVLSLTNGNLLLSSNTGNISVSHDFGASWQKQDRPWSHGVPYDTDWTQTIWQGLYQFDPDRIGVVTSRKNKEGGHDIKIRFGKIN